MHKDKQFIRLAAGMLGLVVFLTYPFLSAKADSPSPLQVIQSGSERGLQIIKSSLFEGGPGLQQRRDEILKIVEEYFDFNELAKRALGRHWKGLAPDKRERYVQLFKQLLFNTYVRRIEASATPTTTIRYERQMIEGRYAVVKTRAVGANQPDVEIDYKLLLSGGQWKVYDVIIEGISLVDNYRQQFSSILDSESFESFLKRLSEKIKEGSGS